MNTRRNVKLRLYASILALITLPLATVLAEDVWTLEDQTKAVEDSYHGRLGKGTGTGMLEKWCALPNFSYYQQDGIDGWYDTTKRDCSNCHIGAYWSTDENKEVPICNKCHTSDTPTLGSRDVTVAKCMGCHKKDISKRGDDFDPLNDVHIAEGLLCQNCHVNTWESKISTHQFKKGTAIDTTEPTMMATLTCIQACHVGDDTLQGHGPRPHDDSATGIALNDHAEKVACETCHTGLRPNGALARRQWNVFTSAGKPVTTMREENWLPEHKWYDNTGPGASGDFDLPILGYTERRNAPGAKIYPFNAVSVDWFVRTRQSAYDDIITVPEVKKADFDGDGTVTVAEMRQVYKHATLMTKDMNFSITHSVLPAEDAFKCQDCHTSLSWVLNWEQLGYEGDPWIEPDDTKPPKKPKK
jgi:hypothetical protein